MAMGLKVSLQRARGCRLARVPSKPWPVRSPPRPLGMFSGKVNPVTGKIEWVPQEWDVTSEESDISPELARLGP